MNIRSSDPPEPAVLTRMGFAYPLNAAIIGVLALTNPFVCRLLQRICTEMPFQGAR